MSATGTRLPLNEARRLAGLVQDCIKGETYVVGSIRRMKADVGDIEIIVHSDAAIDIPIGCGVLMPGTYETVKGGKKDWRYWQIRNVKDGFNVDLFRFDDLNRGSIMLIRTGPAEFSKRFVNCLRRRGLKHADGYVRDNAGLLVPCPTEEIAFKLAGLQWVKSEDRE